MNITEDHLRYMAQRHHATMKKLDGMREKFTGIAGRFVGTIETAAGAWLGGTLEGRTGGAAIGPLPINLGFGVALIGASYLDLANQPGQHRWGDDLQNLGNGFIGSYLAATGYAFGKRWKETGKMLGGGGHPWAHPYEESWPHGAPSAPVAP